MNPKYVSTFTISSDFIIVYLEVLLKNSIAITMLFLLSNFAKFIKGRLFWIIAQLFVISNFD